jgi:predicted transcriptional regulator
MTKTEKALNNLRHTGWHSSQVAEKLGVSPRIARMYLSGERKIPSRLWDKIPAITYSGDTHLKSRMKKEQRINELKKYSFVVPRVI